MVIALGDPSPVFVDEQGLVAAELAPERLLPKHDRGAQRAHDAGIERPRARVVGLVLVQLDRSTVEVHVVQVERRRFGVGAAPFAVEEAVEEAPAQRRPRVAEQLPILVGVEVRLRLRRASRRQETARERIRRDEAQREDRERADAVDEQSVSAPGGGLLVRKRAHDALGVVQREAPERPVPNERVDVPLEDLAVVVSVLLRLHVVRVQARKLARRPALAHVAERDRLRRVREGASLARAHRVDRAADLVEVLPFCGFARAEQEGPRDVDGHAHTAELLGEVREHGEARFRGLLRLARRERDLRPRRRVERDPGVPVVALLVGVPCSLAGHGLSSWG